MSVLRQNTADGGTNATAITTGNSGGVSGNAWSAVNGGTNVWRYSNTHAVKGGMAIQCDQASGVGASLGWNFTTPPTTHYGRAYIYLTSFAASSHPIIKGLDAGFSDLWRIDLTATGQVRMRAPTATILATSTATITTGAWWRIEWKIVSGTGTAGQMVVNVYSGDATTASFSLSNTACNTGSQTNNLQFGPALSSPTVATLYMDEIVIDDAAFPGPANSVNQDPVANAGPNQVVTVGTLVTLDGSGSADSDGTITGYSWVQTGGTSVTLSSATAIQPTFTAPGSPDTLTFELTVTDNAGATDSASVTINVSTVSLLRSNGAEGGVAGSGVTSGNSGGASGDAWNSVVAAHNEWTFTSTNVARGNLAYQCTQVAGADTVLTWDVAALTDFYGRAYYYFTGFPSGSSQIICKGLNAGFASDCWQLSLTIAGQIRVRNAAGSLLATSTNSLTPGMFYRIEWHVVAGSGTSGTFELRVYAADQTVPWYTFANTACDMNTETSHVQFGAALGGGGLLPAFFLDEAALSTSGWIGRAAGTPLSSPPIANAGPDQNVGPNASVTLDGSASTDSDGTIVGYAWVQTGGTSVTLSAANVVSPTFTAPGSAGTLTFQLTVTDNDGESSTDTVAILVQTSIVLSNTAEGGLDGTVVTIGNSGGGSGDAFTNVTGGTSVWRYASAQTARGDLSFQCDQIGGTGAALQWALSTLTAHYGRFYFCLSGFATASHPIVKGFSTGFVNAWRIDINGTGKIVIRDAGSTTRYTSLLSVSTNIWYRLEWYVVSGAGTGRLEMQLYIGDDTTFIQSYDSGASLNIGPETSHVQFGPSLSINPGAPRMWLDELAIGNGAGSWLGPAAGTPINQAPTADAGPDATVEPRISYTLTGTASDDGTIAEWEWRQISGPAVVLSSTTAQNPTLTTPAVIGGTTLVFGLTVTDDQGLLSPEATVTITVLTPTLLFARSGSWLP